MRSYRPLALAQLWRRALLKKGRAHFDATMAKLSPWSIAPLAYWLNRAVNRILLRPCYKE